MTTPIITESPSHGSVGERVELARYTTSTHERVLYGQRIDGHVRITDHPAHGRGRCYLVESQLEQDGLGALNALLRDYLQQAQTLDQIPMAGSRLH